MSKVKRSMRNRLKEKFQQEDDEVGSQQSYQQSQSEFNSTPRKTSMLQFISLLNKKYPILNNISQHQSSQFQTEVITMLIDQQQNVDSELYAQTVEKIGLDKFVLEVLGNVIGKDRRKVEHKEQAQYEKMSKGLEEIVKEVEKQHGEVNVRKKELEKRELTVRKTVERGEKQLRQKAKQIEEKVRKSIVQAEEQMKKRLAKLMTQLRQKQKQTLDKQNTLKQSLKRLKQLQTLNLSLQQKSSTLQTRQKQLSTRQRQLKQKQSSFTQQQQQLKSRVSQLQQQVTGREEELGKTIKKLKTVEASFRAYREESEKRVVRKGEEENQKIRELKGEVEQLGKLLGDRDREVDGLRREVEGREEREKQLFEKEGESLRREVSRLGRMLGQRQKEIQQLNRKLIQKQRELQRLNKQLQQQKCNPHNPNHPTLTPVPKILSQLDISTIPNQDYSIIHPLAQSILVMGDYEHGKFISKDQLSNVEQQQIREMARTIDLDHDVKEMYGEKCQRDDWISKECQESDSEEEMSMSKDRRHLQRVKANSSKLPKSSNNTKPKARTQKPLTSLKAQPPSTHTNNPSPNLLKHQHTPSSQQQQQQQPPTSIPPLNNSNINLFNDYFLTQSSLRPQQHQAPSDIPKPTPLTQLTSVLKLLQQQSCQGLQSISSIFIKQIFIEVEKQHKLSRLAVEPVLELLMAIIEPCHCEWHQKVKIILDGQIQNVVRFLQMAFLKFEAIVSNIEHNAIVILARVLLQREGREGNTEKQWKSPQIKQQLPNLITAPAIKLLEKYLKSLKVKLLVQKDQFIRSNINFLLQYSE